MKSICSLQRFLVGMLLAESLIQSAAQRGENLLIDTTSVSFRDPSRISFRFQGDAGFVGTFELQRSARIGRNAQWNADETAAFQKLTDGVYEFSVSVKPAAPSFYRIVAFEPNGMRLFVNEVMSRNLSALADGNGDFSDWIEIYNPDDAAVDLTGYGVSDDESQPHKWRFPEVLIQPRSFLIVFASGQGSVPPNGHPSASFRLDASGETVVFSDPALRIVDKVVLPALSGDQSFGRMPDGGDEWHIYSKEDSSPGNENSLASLGRFIDPPRFSMDGGFLAGGASAAVELSVSNSNGAIRYTTDGSAPGLNSTRYVEPIVINQTTVIRAVAFDETESSAESSRTFFFGVNHELPVVSMAGDPRHFEFENGFLYGLGPSVLSRSGRVLQNYPFSGSNAWKDRESEVFLEFYGPDQSFGFRMNAGLKIFGGWGSRGYPQKSFALFARAKYGNGKIRYRVFPEKNIPEFEALVLRNSGNDNQSTLQTPIRPPITEFGPTDSYGSYFANGNFTLIRDAMMQRLVSGAGLDTQAYRPAVVYLNGEYWGIYNLREKMNEHYVVSNHGFEKGRIDLIEGYGSVRAGSNRVYQEMRNYISSNNPSAPDVYRFIKETYLDIDNFIDYHLAVIYFQNFDIGNIKCWRPQADGGRFKWMLYDQDYGFNLWPPDVYLPAMARDYSDYDNMFRFYTAGSGTSTGWPNSGGRTMLLRRLLANSEFREQLITRCADLLNSNFREERVVDTIDEMASVIRSEIPAHLHRWSWEEIEKKGFGVPHKPEDKPFTIETWENNLSVLRDFARERPAKVREDAITHFRLRNGAATLDVDVEPSDAGWVRLNSLIVSELPWSGSFFADYPVAVRAIPKPGFVFAGWTGAAGGLSDVSGKLDLPGNENSVISARFARADSGAASSSMLAVTEFQFHPAPDRDSGDWVEIRNTGPEFLSLGGWIFRDSNDDHAFIIPEIALAPGQYLVLCQDAKRFRRVYPDVSECAGDFGFGLGNGGDSVRLFEPNGLSVIDFAFHDEAPWPSDADGSGRTLQLIRPDSSPQNPASWRPSVTPGGSPGAGD